jgi:hypothetical protein
MLQSVADSDKQRVASGPGREDHVWITFGHPRRLGETHAGRHLPSRVDVVRSAHTMVRFRSPTGSGHAVRERCLGSLRLVGGAVGEPRQRLVVNLDKMVRQGKNFVSLAGIIFYQMNSSWTPVLV